MVDFEVQVEGFQRLIDELNEMQEDLNGGDRWIVGTAVEYSVFVEFRHQ
jgi:hypothetical protein